MTNSGAPEPPPLSPEAQQRVKELQAQISDFQKRADVAKDEDVKEAFNLQVSSLGLRVARIKRGLPEEAPVAEEAPLEEEAEEPLPPMTEAQIEEADKLIQRAMLEKRRGNNVAATKFMKEAAETAPGASNVLEALGDELMERRDYGGAKAAFKKALKADPSNTTAERKFGTAALALDGMGSIEDQLRNADSPFLRPEDAMASGGAARFIGFFIPGGGHLVLGLTVKGLAYLGTFIIGLLIFILLRANNGSHNAKSSTWLFAPLVVALVAWIVSLLEVQMMTKSRKKADINRPQPPSHLPF